MKRFFVLTIWLLFSHLSFCQQTEKSHEELRKIGGLQYRNNDFLNAAKTFSSILGLPNFKPTIWDFNNAAYSWSKAGVSDSALYNLEKIAEIDTITFSDYIDISTDQDYTTLHDLSRWKITVDKLFENARKSLLAQLKIADEKDAFSLRFYAAKAWSINNNPDSAFAHLEIIAKSKALTFEKADEILKNPAFKNLKERRKWQDLVEQIFITLNDKYIPQNTWNKKSKKKILIDGAHYNFHDINGTYEVLAGMLRKSRFVVTGQTIPFNETNIKPYDILVIANPLSDRMDSLTKRAQRNKEPYRWSAVATQNAYAESEISAIKNWVNNGGSLLLILDHAPIGKSGGFLAEAFGVESRNVGTYDTLSLDPKVDTSNGARNILFTRSNKLIGSHPIMNGIDSVTTYTGLSLMGPSKSTVLLQLPSTAYDRDWLPETRQFRNRTARGRSQGIAFEFGKGRVVVMGEAAEFRPIFLSRSERGNWQFLLNILRWLSKE